MNMGKGAAAIDGNAWRLVKTEDAVVITQTACNDFLYAYSKAVLLSLKERGVLTAGQLMLCIERLYGPAENG